MRKKKIVLIDMYGVIIKESKGNFIPYTFGHFDISEHKRLWKAIKEEKLFTRAQLGQLSNKEFLTQLGYDNPQAAMEDYLKNYLTLDPEFKSFAKKCSDNFDLCLLSNDVLEWSEFLTEYCHLNRYFSDKIISGAVGMRKPDEEIFKYTLKKLNCSPEDCIFVDNSVTNLKVASRLGIKSILFNRDGEEYDGITVNNFEELENFLCKIDESENRQTVMDSETKKHSPSIKKRSLKLWKRL